MSVRTIVKSIQDIMRQDTGVDGDAQRISQLCWMFFLKIIDDQDQELELLKRRLPLADPEEVPMAHLGGGPGGHHRRGAARLRQRRAVPGPEEPCDLDGKPGDRRRVVKDVFEDAYNYMKSGQLMRQVVNKINEVDFNNLAERQHFGDIYEQILNDLQSAGNAGEYYTPRAVTAFMVDRIDPHPGEILFDPACGTGGFLTCAHAPHARALREAARGRAEDAGGLARGREEAASAHALRHQHAAARHRGPELRAPRQHAGAALHQLHAKRPRRHRAHQSALRRARGRRHREQLPEAFPARARRRICFSPSSSACLKPGGRAAVVLPDGTLFGEGVKTRLKEHLMEECNLHTIVRLPNSVFKPYASIGTNLLFFEKGEPTKDIWFYEHRVPEGQKAYSMTKPIRFEHLQGCIDWWGGQKRKGREETPQAWKVTAEEVKARGYNLDIKNPHTVADDHGDPEELLASSERRRGRDGAPCATS